MRFIKVSVAVAVALSLLLSWSGPVGLSALSGETPALTLTGTQNAQSVLRNMNFTDVRASGSWAKSAIYECAALELMKGSSGVFGLNENITIEQALATLYNSAGREAEAQRAAEALDAARASDAKLYPAPRMWSDGYIQLAFYDGLITYRDYTDALSSNQSSLGPGSFYRSAYATREKIAEYIARILGLEPVNSQTRIFNSYNDWETADPHSIPYIEALLRNHVMSDDGRGYFRPKGYVTRAEMAQLLVNAEPLIFRIRGIRKMKGVVESVVLNQDLSTGNRINTYLINIRNSSGDLHQLTSIEMQDGSTRNEQTGGLQSLIVSSVVRRNDTLGLAGMLRAGESINYFVNAENEVPYIEVIDPATDVRHFLGKVASVDASRRQVAFSPYLEIPYADIRLVDNKTLSMAKPTNSTVLYSVSNAAIVYSDSGQGGFDLIKPDLFYVITVRNGVIDTLARTGMGLMEEAGLASGVVREVNPSLGYITLYFSDGTGMSPDAEDSLTSLRTYSYAYEVPITRDGKSASFGDIVPGDYAFIRLDEDGYIERLSAQSYYSPLYGTVYMKGPSSLTLKLDDGSYRTLPVSAGIPVHRNNKPATLSDVLEGDRVRVLIQTSGASISIGGIELERAASVISAIYRGDVEYYDDLNNALALSRVQEFVNGRWEETQFIGIKPFQYNREYKERPTGRISGKAYIAVRKDPDGIERIVMASIRPMPQYEEVLKDSILALSSSLKLLELENTSGLIGFDSGTIAIRDGRLVDMTALNALDPVMISADKPSGSNRLVGQVVVSDTRKAAGSLTVYRGRIKSVDQFRTFTVESFAQLSGTSWVFSNTPKTFNIDLAVTRLLEDDGVGSMREFDGSWVNRSVYVVTDGLKALLVSTAPYAEEIHTGRVAGLAGGTVDSNGSYLTNPTGLSLKEAMRYDTADFIWKSVPNANIDIPPNAIILKDGAATEITAIRAGDSVRIISNGTQGIIVMAD